MSPATDAVVLSSSPERNAVSPSPHPVKDAGNGSLDDNLSFPLASSTELSRPPTRSRYFAPPKFNQPATKDRIAEDARTAKRTAMELDVVNELKSTSRVREPQTGPQAESCELENGVLENNENAATKPKRTRKKPAGSEAGGEKLKNKTITGKVTKSGTAKPKKTSAKSADCDLTSKSAHEGNAGKEDKDSCEYGLKLESATKRRLDWTPTKEPAKSISELEGEGGVEGRQNSLSTLLFSYGYDGVATAPDRAQTLADSGPTKRRRIELVDSRVLPAKPKPLADDDSHNSEGDPNISATSKSSKLSKKPKRRAKRLTTLTARVTASYHETSTDCSDSTGQAASVTTESPKADKPGSRKTKRKADENSGFKMPRRIVLSPQDALDSLDQQDLVFGTCSQLERADSPTLLRDTQAALQESEKESSCALPFRLNECPGPARSSSAISRFTAPRNLWSAAARDTEGSLVDLEVVDLVDSPEVPKVASPSVHDNIEKVDQTGDASGLSHSSDISRTDNLAPDAAPVNDESHASNAQVVEQQSTRNKPKQKPNFNEKTDLQLTVAIKRYGLKAIKNRKKMIEILEKCWVAQNGPVAQEGYDALQPKETTAAISTVSAESQPAKRQKRPTKPKVTPQKKPKAQRQSQPGTSQQKEVTNETTITASESKQTPTKPKSQQSSLSDVQTIRGSQPPPQRSFVDVEEIQDSEDELLPSPSRIFDELSSKVQPKEASKKQELPTFTTPSSPSSPSRKAKAMQSISLASASSNPQLPDLGEQITKAVRAQPRQNRSPVGIRKRPSWHEKILMYDPIYLEDFTRWLNTEGLNLVNEDREVGAGFVREWCEKKGICCCYKVKKNAGHS